jgi:predicted HicB family RNase H-like nuclease
LPEASTHVTDDRMPSCSPNSHPAPSGYKRLTLEIPAADHARFKSICALRGTTMGREISAAIAAQLEERDPRLSETLYVRVSPQMRRELADYAKERRVSLSDPLTEAFGLLQRKHEPVNMEVSRDYGPYPVGKRPRLVAQGR